MNKGIPAKVYHGRSRSTFDNGNKNKGFPLKFIMGEAGTQLILEIKNKEIPSEVYHGRSRNTFDNGNKKQKDSLLRGNE
jgi:hypothetical protein